MSLLTLKNLQVAFRGLFDGTPVLEEFSLTVAPGERIGIVGESGSGKTVSMLAWLGLLPKTAMVQYDEFLFEGQKPKIVLGREVAMIFQDPTNSLNPSLTIGFQLCEKIILHERLNSKAAKERAEALLELVKIPEACARMHAYPHQLSGGMCQRVMIALALVGHPQLLIADEPTTALDVSIQAQILELLLELNREFGMALILISHNLAVVSAITERLLVMYAGQIVEEGNTKEILSAPDHPYTEALLRAMPEGAHLKSKARIATIPGCIPLPHEFCKGCRFSPRCSYATSLCETAPLLEQKSDGRFARCWYPLHAKW